MDIDTEDSKTQGIDGEGLGATGSKESIEKIIAAGLALEAGDTARAEALLGEVTKVPQAELLRARVATQKGEYEEAIRRYHSLTDVSREYENQRVIALAKVLALAKRYAEAASQVDTLLARSGEITSREKVELIELKAEWFTHGGRVSEAAAAYREAISISDSSSKKERLQIELGKVLFTDGKNEEANQILGPLALEASSGRIMSSALAELNKAKFYPIWDDSTRLERARTLMKFRAWKAAEDTLSPILKSSRPNIRKEAEFLNARILFSKRRHYKEALVALEPIAKSGSNHADEAAFLMARALSRLDRDEEAIVAYNGYAKKTKRPGRADEARFLSGRLEFYLGMHKAALRTMERLVGNGKSNKSGKSSLNAGRRRDSHYIAGMSALLLEKPARAEPHLVAASKGSQNDDVLSRNRYWVAVAKTKKNAKKGAAALRDICARDATSWYARLSDQRLKDLGEDADECKIDGISKKVDPPPDGPAIEPLENLSKLSFFFAQSGLHREAALELRKSEKEGKVRADATSWIHHYVALDAPHFAIRRAIRGLKWPPGPDDKWRVGAAYPMPYEKLVADVENEQGLPKRLIHAIARKESLFDPKAVSSVGAMGLMQMMPRTYETNRKRAGLPPLVEGELPGPQPSIRAASFEFAFLLEKFDGSLPLAIMAYNGGPAAVTRWLDRSGDSPMDIFVEKAGFAQTRNYVKRVYKNLIRYRLIAGEPLPEIPKTANRPK